MINIRLINPITRPIINPFVLNFMGGTVVSVPVEDVPVEDVPVEDVPVDIPTGNVAEIE